MSDTYKWGTWYPIGTVPPNYYRCFSIWDERSAPCAQVVEQRELRYHPEATHWMPLPPSPEEMAAKPSLEQLLRKRRGYYRGLPLDDPKSMHINATSRVVYKEICNLLKEAGLE